MGEVKGIAADLRRQAEAAAGLVAALTSEGMGDDGELLSDMVEGETGFNDAIERAVAELDECEVMRSGLKAKEQSFADRRARIEARAETVRGLIEQAMAIAGVQTVKLATATLTIKTLPPKPIISEEADIPAQFWKQAAPVIDKTAINAAIKDGQDIPGIVMSNGTLSLTIRRQ